MGWKATVSHGTSWQLVIPKSSPNWGVSWSSTSWLPTRCPPHHAPFCPRVLTDIVLSKSPPQKFDSSGQKRKKVIEKENSHLYFKRGEEGQLWNVTNFYQLRKTETVSFALFYTVPITVAETQSLKCLWATLSLYDEYYVQMIPFSPSIK